MAPFFYQGGNAHGKRGGGGQYYIGLQLQYFHACQKGKLKEQPYSFQIRGRVAGPFGTQHVEPDAFDLHVIPPFFKFFGKTVGSGQKILPHVRFPRVF